MYFVYILYSVTYDKYYVGHTSDVEKRLVKHNLSIDSKTYTSKYRPWVLKYSFAVSDQRSDAVRIENFIKKQKSTKFIERIIEESWESSNFFL